MISIDFQASPNHVLATFSRMDAFNIGEGNSIQRSPNVYFSVVLLTSNQLPLFLSFIKGLAGFYRRYRSIANCFGNLN